jgi:putative membrane protein
MGVVMGIVSRSLVIIVALLHVGFLVLEMFLWTGPIGQRVFATTPEFAAQSAVLAANQGLYNGFLAAGLLWGAIANKREVMIFFLLCVIVAGVYGGLTAKMSILYVQAAPALVALATVLLAQRNERAAPLS